MKKSVAFMFEKEDEINFISILCSFIDDTNLMECDQHVFTEEQIDNIQEGLKKIIKSEEEDRFARALARGYYYTLREVIESSVIDGYVIDN